MVTCSNGAAFKLDIGLEEIERDDVVLVCGEEQLATVIVELEAASAVGCAVLLTTGWLSGRLG